ncbi:MAG: peptidylprolyl isomerase [Nonlabens sp.]|uniref:peptidylprolyl isomerase n=1 Tax=Nonlabens sp. TaxID=1888209 RepID=UPI003EF981B8
MKKVHGILLLLAVILTGASCEEDKYKDAPDGIYAEIVTDKGTMFAELYYEATPLTVANYVALAEGNHPTLAVDSLKGKPYYDGLLFHRVMKGFMIQGGDFSGTGSGNVGYKFDQEIVDSLKHDEKGVLSMANAGPNTNGAQFFIMDKATPSLDGKYNVFGKVVEGLAVIDSIAAIPVNAQANHRPLEEVKMQTIRIIRKGKAAKKWDAVKTFTSIQEEKAAAAEKAAVLAAERQAQAADMVAKKAAQLAEWRSKATKLSDSDVMVYKLEEGSGVKPALGSQIKIDYAGFFKDGNLFDTSNVDTAQIYGNYNVRKDQAGAYQAIPVKYDPATPMGAVGFKHAYLTMNYGDKIVAFVPSDLGYGERGAGNVIPPNAELIFEMEVLPQE